MSAPAIEPLTTNSAAPRWLSVIGIGEDGIEGLAPVARSLIERAELVAGGARHLALAGSLIKGERLAWPSPMTDALDTIERYRGRATVILATGDPFHYGVGKMLVNRFSADELICLPQPSAFSLAAARLGWSVPDATLVTLHGRAMENLHRHLLPRARILALSWDGTTPQKVAAALTQRGLGSSNLTVLEAMGGSNERIRTCKAHAFEYEDVSNLNTLAIELPGSAETGAPVHAFARISPGLEDDAFEHDGQITKCDVRAMTIAALAPRPGEHLWDIGLGAGSIAIEWLLCHSSLRATGFEQDETRAARALRNAAVLGAPSLEVVHGMAPGTLKDRPPPDAVFVGGGVSADGLLEAAWAALPSGGRLVANAVTLESESRLIEVSARFGGELVKIGISHANPVGRLRGWRGAMPVTQWRVTKP